MTMRTYLIEKFGALGELLRGWRRFGSRLCVCRYHEGEKQSARHEARINPHSILRSDRGNGGVRPGHLHRSLLGCQSEHPTETAGRNLGQPLVTREQVVDTTNPAGDGDVLHAVLLPGDRLTFDARASLELPELLAVINADRLELAGQLAGEHHAARRRKHAREARNVTLGFPFGFAGHGI